MIKEKKILITGMNSYIGNSVLNYLLQYPNLYKVDIKDTFDWTPKESDFVGYDVVFNVAGIAHIKETKKNTSLYYKVNRDLSIKIAETAKLAGVKQYILLSTMSVYGLVVGEIGKDTPIKPINSYGKSKAEADDAIKQIADNNFKFVCLRPPMVYGKGCKGNYQSLRKFALKFPFFPKYNNQRSMIYIGNLCEFIKNCIDMEKAGLYFPQNDYYINTSEMVYKIAKNNGKKIFLTPIFNFLIKIVNINIIKKVFGNLVYEKVDTIKKYDFEESIRLSEE